MNTQVHALNEQDLQVIHGGGAGAPLSWSPTIFPQYPGIPLIEFANDGKITKAAKEA